MNSYLRAEPIFIGSALTCIIQGVFCMSIGPADTGLFTDCVLPAVPQNKSPAGNGSVPSPDGDQSIFFVISIVARYSIFRRLSSDGNTVLDLVTFRNCRLNPSMALVV